MDAEGTGRTQEPPYPRAEPPGALYHAVPEADADRVARDGLSPTGRPHVHLARRPDHARGAVGEGRGPAVVFVVDAAAMHAAGHAFYVSPKATWLCDRVPPRFLARLG